MGVDAGVDTDMMWTCARALCVPTRCGPAAEAEAEAAGAKRASGRAGEWGRFRGEKMEEVLGGAAWRAGCAST